MKHHTFAVYVEDQPGVLNRVSSLFRRRGFNIHSLSVGNSESAGISRMTIVVPTDSTGAARIRALLEKLIPVVRVEDLSERPAVVRDLALIRVAASHESRAAVMQLVQVFDGRIVDVAPASLVVEICASEAKVDGLVEVLRPYGVLEMVRTGRVAMDRGSAGEAWQVAPGPSTSLGAGPSTSLGAGPSASLGAAATGAADGLSCSV